MTPYEQAYRSFFDTPGDHWNELFALLDVAQPLTCLRANEAADAAGVNRRTENVNETFELNEAEKSALKALNRKWDMEVQSNKLVLAECGWGDFYGISMGGGEVRFDELVAEGLLQKRPHHLYEGDYVYRCIGRGFAVADELQEQEDAAEIAAWLANPTPPADYDEIPF